jgi:SAM-dependent methyltransferase
MGNWLKLLKDKCLASIKVYDDRFYQRQFDESYNSAKKYAEILWPLYKPTSVIDVGCGRGPWLKAFKDKGVAKVCGIDGDWNSQKKMFDDAIIFRSGDLNKPFAHIFDQKFDLAMCVEVAEHLKPASATMVIESLTKLSDVVLFGAAFIKQGGTNHLNEQLPTYWAEIFSSFGYVPFDIFRPVLWGDKEVGFWYQQNAFLYVRKESHFFQLLLELGQEPLKNPFFLNCVHPVLYKMHTDPDFNLQALRFFKRFTPDFLFPLVRKLKAKLLF